MSGPPPSPPLVGLEDVGVRYRLHGRGGRGRSLHQWLRSLVGRRNGGRGGDASGAGNGAAHSAHSAHSGPAGRVDRAERAIWAIRGVTLSVAQGEVLGVIGPNGSGKSTLLQAMSGILAPDEGRVHVRASIACILSLGAGFRPELTGAENVYLHGAFLGLSRRDVAARFDAIVEFADLGDFIDEPVRTYSTGMRSRLGFAIAAEVDADVLLLDEVLGAGDAAFRARSERRVREIIARSRAVVAVTHDLDFVRESCTRAVRLDRGRAVEVGPPAEVVGAYLASVSSGRK